MFLQKSTLFKEYLVIQFTQLLLIIVSTDRYQFSVFSKYNSIFILILLVQIINSFSTFLVPHHLTSECNQSTRICVTRVITYKMSIQCLQLSQPHIFKHPNITFQLLLTINTLLDIRYEHYCVPQSHQYQLIPFFLLVLANLPLRNHHTVYLTHIQFTLTNSFLHFHVSLQLS